MNNLYPKSPIILLVIIWSVSAEEMIDSLCAESLECDCGTPAWPLDVDLLVKKAWDVDNTGLETFNKSNETHSENKNQVLYRCSHENDLLVGNDVRECNRGRWLGDVPRCAINLMNETQVSSVEIVDVNRKLRSRTIQVKGKVNTFGAFTPPVAKQPDNCLKWQTSEKQIWMIYLSSEVNVQYIRFKLFAENIQQFWNNREFIINVFLNSVKGTASTECEYTPHPNMNLRENNGNNNQNKNYLSLEYGCDFEARNHSKVNKIVFNFSYVRKMMRILSISLCELKLYYFEQKCGQPDYPTTVQVRRSYLVELDVIEQYEFLCNDNDHTLEGKTHIRCGSNGKWMDEFPFCVPKSFCKRLTFDRIGKNVIIEYEDAMYEESGDIIVPNGKMAKFACNNSAENRTPFRLQGISRVLCSNGKWHGLTATERPDCVSKNLDVIPIPKRIIRILSIVLAICVILIVILGFLMVRARRAVRRKTLDEIKNSLKRDYKIDYENDYEFDDNKSQIYGDIPHIYYSCDDLDSCHGMQNNSIYKDDLSDKFFEIEKTNSIYSNL